jgi:Ca2+-binding RTX toxin-like protein
VCTPQPGGIKVEAGDGVDIVNSGVVPGGGPIAISGGPGDDVLRGDALGETFDGGAGVDKITGDDGDDIIHGGADHDELEGQVGNDQVHGDDGDDTLAGDGIRDEAGHDVIDGGAGYDNVEYDWEVESGHHQPPITITEDGAANDGRPGENDNVTSLEEIYLNAPATLIGDAEADDYTVFNTDESPSTLRGGGGGDTLTGGFGNDTITGGPGRDTIYADVSSSYCNWIQCDLPHGNDAIDVRDGEADQVECGVGQDTVQADKLDTVSTDCETVVRDGSVPPQQPGTDGPQGPAGPGGATLTAMVHKARLRKALAKGLAIDVAVPAAGKLTATATAKGRSVAKGAALAARADVVTVRVRFTRAGRKALRGARKAKLALALRFVPSAGGAAATGGATVTLKR